jgi:hypothetical protein
MADHKSLSVGEDPNLNKELSSRLKFLSNKLNFDKEQVENLTTALFLSADQIINSKKSTESSFGVACRLGEMIEFSTMAIASAVEDKKDTQKRLLSDYRTHLKSRLSSHVPEEEEIDELVEQPKYDPDFRSDANNMVDKKKEFLVNRLSLNENNAESFLDQLRECTSHIIDSNKSPFDQAAKLSELTDFCIGIIRYQVNSYRDDPHLSDDFMKHYNFKIAEIYQRIKEGNLFTEFGGQKLNLT